MTPGAAPLGFGIRVPGRDAFRKRLAARGVEAFVHWSEWLLPVGVPGRFPDAERLAAEVLPLPCHQGLSAGDVERACRAVLAAL